MSNVHRIEFELNGRERVVRAATTDTLLDTLRNELGLYSVRSACGIGICGTCTVLVDGRPISSCLSLTVLNRGRSIVTSEGLVGKAGELDEVQEAFVRNNAFQCSYCIPAMVLTVRAYLDSEEHPTVDGARQALAGNLCRCGSYPQVIEALHELVTRDTRA